MLKPPGPLNVFTLLWQRPDGKPYEYCTLPETEPKRVEARLYTPSEVIRFQQMVKRHLPFANFYCLTNVEIPGVNCLPLVTPNLEAWWFQMEIFRPGLPKGRNVYSDLDVVWIRDIKRIAFYKSPFAIIKAGGKVGSLTPPTPWRDHEGRWRYPLYQGSMKVWDSSYVKKFWNAFDPVEDPKHYASDQDWLADKFPKENTLPNRWFQTIYCCSKFETPDPPCKVVLTVNMQNDKAARLYPWVQHYWTK